jgi:hypothetical protein
MCLRLGLLLLRAGQEHLGQREMSQRQDVAVARGALTSHLPYVWAGRGSVTAGSRASSDWPAPPCEGGARI